MNTVQELIDNGICIEPYTAENMIRVYQSKIGLIFGVNKVIDVNYLYHDGIKDVTLKCTNCGNISHSTIKGSKWYKIRKKCPCQKEMKKQRELELSEKFQKEKKTKILSRVGNTYGDYKIMSANDIDTDKPTYTMQCNICGCEKEISAKESSFNSRIDFHCTKHYEQIKYDKSYIGKKNNFLTVIGITRAENGHRMFDCRCNCGTVKQIEPAHWDKSIVKSCGCKQIELLSAANTKHGHSGDRLYCVWRNMIERCQNKKNENFRNYGGRGIRVCDEWKNDFTKFYDWAMGNGYDYDAEYGECTIDRIDVNGNYEPSNCRWADRITQANNKRPSSEWKPRKTKTWTIDGVTKPQKEWCEEYGAELMTVRYRIKHKGLSVLEALTMPKMTTGRPKKVV